MELPVNRQVADWDASPARLGGPGVSAPSWVRPASAAGPRLDSRRTRLPPRRSEQLQASGMSRRAMTCRSFRAALHHTDGCRRRVLVTNPGSMVRWHCCSLSARRGPACAPIQGNKHDSVGHQSRTLSCNPPPGQVSIQTDREHRTSEGNLQPCHDRNKPPIPPPVVRQSQKHSPVKGIAERKGPRQISSHGRIGEGTEVEPVAVNSIHPFERQQSTRSCQEKDPGVE